MPRRLVEQCYCQRKDFKGRKSPYSTLPYSMKSSAEGANEYESQATTAEATPSSAHRYREVAEMPKIKIEIDNGQNQPLANVLKPAKLSVNKLTI